MKFMIGINTLTAVDQPIYSNHCQFWYHLGVNFPPPEHRFAFHSPRRMSIDRMRNMTAKLALELEMDYVLFIDDDVVIPIHSLEKLVKSNKDVIAGWTIIRGHPFQNMFFKYEDVEKRKLMHLQKFKADEEGLVEVDAVGFSYALIKCDLLKRVPPPWFLTGPYNTEDIYFCIKAKEFVSNVSIFVDTTIKTWHLLGPELIGPDNRDNYKEYFERQFPESCIEENPSVDRGEDYLKEIKEAAENVQQPGNAINT
jgi:hypothetical protein